LVVAQQWGNSTNWGLQVLLAHREIRGLQLAATAPFTEASCGYVGVNDGWTTWLTTIASIAVSESLDGNIALTGGLDLSNGTEFTLGVAFGTLCTMR